MGSCQKDPTKLLNWYARNEGIWYESIELDTAAAEVGLWNCAKAYPELTKDGEDEIGVMTWQDVRKTADKIFRLAMRCSDPAVPKWKIGTAYRAVRLFGGKPARTVG